MGLVLSNGSSNSQAKETHVENFLSDEDEDAVRSMEESSCSSSRSMMEHVESPFVAPTGVCLSHAVVELA